jgi:hypothetical protein
MSLRTFCSDPPHRPGLLPHDNTLPRADLTEGSRKRCRDAISTSRHSKPRRAGAREHDGDLAAIQPRPIRGINRSQGGRLRYCGRCLARELGYLVCEGDVGGCCRKAAARAPGRAGTTYC